jgi:hypothetical protein
MKKLFDINEDEKNRILEMHVNATKNFYLNEQSAPSPRTLGDVNKPSGKIGYTEIAGETDMSPIVKASVLTNIGVPATPENFNNTFFYTDRKGLVTAASAKNLGTFTMTTKRTTKSPDNLFVRYKDGSEVKIEGEGTQEFLTKDLSFIGGAGNGLLALQRALVNGNGYIPSKIKITLKGGRTGGSYNYNSALVNNTDSKFNALLAHFIKPLVDPNKISSTYPFRSILKGQPEPGLDIKSTLVSFLATFLPKPFQKNVQEYGLDMSVDYFENLINASAELSQLDTKWNDIQKQIVAKYRENLEKFLSVKFPNEKDRFLSVFNPDTSRVTPTLELRKVNSTFLPGYSTPQQSPSEKQKSQEFKKGVAK